MPTYDFQHNETGDIWEDTMSYSEKESYMKEHNCHSIILSTPQVLGTSGDVFSRSSDVFKDKMKAVKKGYPTTGPNAAKMEGW